VVIIVPSRKTAKRTQVVRGKKAAELYEAKRRQQKVLISNELREAGRNLLKMLAND